MSLDEHILMYCCCDRQWWSMIMIIVHKIHERGRNVWQALMSKEMPTNVMHRWWLWLLKVDLVWWMPCNNFVLLIESDMLNGQGGVKGSRMVKRRCRWCIVLSTRIPSGAYWVSMSDKFKTVMHTTGHIVHLTMYHGWAYGVYCTSVMDHPMSAHKADYNQY